MLGKGAEVDASGIRGITPFGRAAASGQLENMRILLKAGADINGFQHERPSRYKLTALFGAARGGHLDAVKFLIENGVNVDSRNGQGDTVLMETAGRPYPADPDGAYEDRDQGAEYRF